MSPERLEAIEERADAARRDVADLAAEVKRLRFALWAISGTLERGALGQTPARREAINAACELVDVALGLSEVSA